MGKRKKKKKKASNIASRVAKSSKGASSQSTDRLAEKSGAKDSDKVSTQAGTAPEVKKDNSSTTKQKEKKKKSSLSNVEQKIIQNIRPKSRFRRMLPDIIRVVVALIVISVGAAIWWKPPLMTASFPVTSYKYKGQPFKEATLYRPMAMPERYYVRLPRELEGRYEWFAIDRRREEVALTEEPSHSFLGNTAVKRSDPLGFDLEFRKIDGHEWLIHFFEDSIVFSNNLLCVRLDTKPPEKKSEQ